MGKILDISHHQPPSAINYDKLAKELDFVIIRTQYGSNVVDRYYKTHHAEFKKRVVPRHAYAWVRGENIANMEREAEDFYNRTKDLNPEVWWLDVEEKSMADMRAGVSAYVKKLRHLGVKKIGIYIAHHLYKAFNLNLSEVDAVWIPRYGKNDGQQNEKPDFPCDLWQYTSQGKLNGYAGPLDLNQLTGTKSLEWFTGKDNKKPVASKPKNDKPKSSGKSIMKTIQSTLNKRYKTDLTIDGYYGPKTKKALLKGLQIELNKQFDARLKVDGVWGPNTAEAIESVRKGANGNISWIVQAMLYCAGYDPKGLDGKFGNNTAAALLRFQKDKRISEDAVAGRKTFEKMYA